MKNSTIDLRPDISVITPIYMVQDHLPLCIDSVISQTFANWELILVDDGSNDSCGEICDRYAENDSRIVVLHKQSEGLLKARMDGVEKARADYVTFLDGDDYYLPNRLQCLWDQICSRPVDLLVTGHSRNYESGAKEVVTEIGFAGQYVDEEIRLAQRDYIKYRSQGGSRFVFSWAKLYKKDCIMRAFACLDENVSIGEDAVTTLSIMNEVNSICVANEDTSYVYNIRHTSMCRSYFED